MRSILVVGLMALLSLAFLSPGRQPIPVQQDAPPIPLNEYWEMVENTQQAVSRMTSGPGTAARKELDTLASQWDQVSTVELPDGSILPVHAEYLTAELRANPPDLARLEKLLDTLLQAHEQYPQKVFTLEDIDPLRKILARPEFQWEVQQPIELPGWLGRIYDAIANFIDRIVFAVANALYQSRTAFIVIGALAFALILLSISRSLSRNLAGNAELEGEEGEGDTILTSKGALQRAQTLSTQGDYRNAVRYLYLSSLLVLDEQGLLRYDRSRTNREYLRSVSSHPELANPLRDVIDVFDRVWYGYEPVDDQTYQAYREHVEELREKKE